MKKVAVCGTIASGKSVVCQLLQSKGAYTISSDEIVHRLYSLPLIIQKVTQICGPNVVKDGKIDRQMVANCVFSNENKLKELEDLLRPLVLEKINTTYKTVQNEDYPLFVVEVPLLFEAQWDSFFDRIITVDSDPNIALKRYTASGHTSEEFEARSKRFIDREERNQRSHIVIPNNGSLEDLKAIINQLQT